ncbi:MAG: M56 family metallopeptidase [Chitinophagaceae bacterium]
MPYVIQFLLKFSLSLGMMFLFYQLVLRPLTFYQWNRFYLVCYSLLSFIIPFINITPWIGSDNADSRLMNVIPVIDNMRLPAGFLSADIPEGAGLVRWDLLYLVLVTGVVIMIVRLILQFKSLQAIRQKAVKLSAGVIQLYDVGTDITPFSFANSIFLNSRLHSEEELQKIIQHEFVHVKHKHTIDILIGEFLCIINWFNPFAWLIRRAIRQNLEFIADHHVLQSGLDARQYQYLLLKVIGIPQFSITTHFNFSSLKKRIIMMNKMKSARLHLVKFLFVLPMLAVLLLAYRQKQVISSAWTMRQSPVHQSIDTVPLPAERVKTVSVDTLFVPLVPPATPTVIEVGKVQFVPVPPLPPQPPKPALPKNVKSVIINTNATIEYKDGRKEHYDFNKPEDKAAYEKKFGALPAVPTPPAEPVNKNDLKESTLTLKESTIALTDINPQPLIVMDGNVLPVGTDIKTIDPNIIISIDVLKGTNATDLYHEKGVNGVLLIGTKNGNRVIKPDVVERRISESQISVRSAKVSVNDLENFEGLVIVNGKEVKKEEFSKLDPDSIKQLTILKGDEAVKQYKDKGKNGVIIVVSKTSDKK